MLMIVASHVATSVVGDDATVAWLTRWCGFDRWGEWGTGVFFFLSGYGMTLSLSRQETLGWHYARRKIVRLFEPYLLFWVFYLVVLLVLDSKQVDVSLIPAFLTLGMPLGVDAWFFKVIVGVYALMMLLYMMPISQRARLAVMTAAAVGYYMMMRHWECGPWWYNTILNFPLGMCFALYYDKISRHAFAVLLLAVAFGVASRFVQAGFVGNTCFTLACVWLLQYIPVACRPLVFVGTNSLFFYFLEEPVYHYLVASASSCFPLYFFATIVVVYALVWLYKGLLRHATDKAGRPQ